MSGTVPQLPMRLTRHGTQRQRGEESEDEGLALLFIFAPF